MKGWSFQSLDATEPPSREGDGRPVNLPPEKLQNRNEILTRLASARTWVKENALCFSCIILAMAVGGYVGYFVIRLSSLSEATADPVPPSTPPPSPPPPFLCVLGYWPVFISVYESNGHSPINASHTHVLEGVTYWMPNQFDAAIHNGTCPDDAAYKSPSPPPPYPPPPPTAISCMPTSVPLRNTGVSYTINSSSDNVYIGQSVYTFTDVPLEHPFRLVPHGTDGNSCNPSVVSATGSMSSMPTGAYYYYGTVVYDFSACHAPSAIEFQCVHHNTMDSGKPIMTMHTGC